MKISKKQLREIIAEEREKIDEQGFHSMSRAGKALANSIKGKFVRMYPDAKVGIDGRGGFITVNGKKAIDMSQATGRGMSDDEMIEKMHAVYAETQIDADVPTADSRMDTFREGKMKITKNKLKRIINEEKSRLLSEITPADRAKELSSAAKDMASQASDARAAARHSDKNQLTLNQGEVDKIESMRSALDKMYFEYQKIKSVPPQWLDDGNKFGESRYDKLEMLLMDAAEELSDLAADMKKGGI